MYLDGKTKVLAFTATRVTSKLIGIGAAKRALGNLNSINTGQRSHLGGAKIEKLSIISTTYKLEYAMIRPLALEKLECQDMNTLWGAEMRDLISDWRSLHQRTSKW